MFKTANSENVSTHIIILVTKWEHKLYVSAFCHQTSFPFVLLQPCFHSFLTSCDLSDFTLKFVIWKVKQNICILNFICTVKNCKIKGKNIDWRCLLNSKTKHYHMELQKNSLKNGQKRVRLQKLNCLVQIYRFPITY